LGSTIFSLGSEAYVRQSFGRCRSDAFPPDANLLAVNMYSHLQAARAFIITTRMTVPLSPKRQSPAMLFDIGTFDGLHKPPFCRPADRARWSTRPA